MGAPLMAEFPPISSRRNRKSSANAAFLFLFVTTNSLGSLGESTPACIWAVRSLSLRSSCATLVALCALRGLGGAGVCCEHGLFRRSHLSHLKANADVETHLAFALAQVVQARGPLLFCSSSMNTRSAGEVATSLCLAVMPDSFVRRKQGLD